eukprot:2077765-Rhodomonas_salina.1
MRGHPESAAVQEAGCGALRSLAFNASDQVGLAGMGGLEAVLEAMRGHPESAGVQEAGLRAVIDAMRGHPDSAGVQEVGCGALRNLSVDKDIRIKIAGMGGRLA